MTRSRVVTVALIASLAINLLFVGALIGWRVWGPDGRPGFPPHFGWMMRGLDEQTRDELKPVIRRQAQQLIPLRKRMRNEQLRFNAALTSEPFDERALDQALTDLRQTTEAFQAVMHQQMLTVIEKMGPEERKRVARYLRHRGPGDRHRSHTPRDPPPDEIPPP